MAATTQASKTGLSFVHLDRSRASAQTLPKPGTMTTGSFTDYLIVDAEINRIDKENNPPVDRYPTILLNANRSEKNFED